MEEDEEVMEDDEAMMITKDDWMDIWEILHEKHAMREGY